MSALQAVVSVAIAALVLVRVIGRQVTGSPVTARSLVLMPAVLLVIGVAGMGNVLGSASTGALLLFGADVALLVLVGLGRGASVALGERNGTLYQRGTRLTLLLWLLTIALRVGFAFAGHLLGVDDRLAGASIALSMGLTIGAQNVAIWWRGQRLGVPMAVPAARR
ncbi:hypothetical protein [Gandjariella thermophila]|uniref:hypothetical protein n=1 Tax=Gandjariella thermophila TaxID=1931992 RepID=UPI0010F886DB|nr:hypothetical protein [Gandjariella thermophila]